MRSSPKQPFEPDRTREQQLHRFLGTRGGRKVHYGRILAEAPDNVEIPVRWPVCSPSFEATRAAGLATAQGLRAVRAAGTLISAIRYMYLHSFGEFDRLAPLSLRPAVLTAHSHVQSNPASQRKGAVESVWWSDVYVNAVAMELGRVEDTAIAVGDGRYDRELREAHGYLSVSVIEDERGVLEVAVDAANGALSRAGIRPADVRLVVHVSCETHGPDDFPPASYVQGRTVGNTALAVEVRQACNGALAALELGAAYLSAAPASVCALVTTSDRIQPGTDRYHAGRGGELAGDGATAAVLSRGAGVARLLSTAVVGDGRFLGVGAADPDEFPSRAAHRTEQRRRLRPMLRAMAEHERRSVELALADAGLASGDISRWVFANVGQFLVDRDFRKDFGITEPMTTWDWGRTVGHLGAGNQLAGLTHLIETGAVRAGDRVALCGNGVGFSYGCAIVEISTEPGWAGCSWSPHQSPATAGGEEEGHDRGSAVRG